MSITSNNPLQINQLPISLEIPDDPKEGQEIISLYLKRVANTVNTKTGGLYSINELGNTEQFNTSSDPGVFNDVYRKCFDLVQLNGGNIGGSATVSFPHNINGLLNPTLIYASCNDGTRLFSEIGYANVYLTSTNVVFTNSSPNPLTYCVVIAQYTKTV